MKRRLDDILIEKSLAESKKNAFIIVTGGRVLVNGQKAVSPSQMVGKDVKIELLEEKKYVGRGALKLEAALKNFDIDVYGKICVDIGSATGGFVQVLLEYGAKKVYAIDTAKGKLDLKIRGDKRVVVMENTDVRDIDLSPHLLARSGIKQERVDKTFYTRDKTTRYSIRWGDKLPELVNIVTIDVSLISLRNILPHAGRFLEKDGAIIVLFKPQYETRNPKILKHGVIRDSKARENLLNDFLQWLSENNWRVLGKMESPVHGSEGNIEYLLYVTL